MKPVLTTTLVLLMVAALSVPSAVAQAPDKADPDAANQKPPAPALDPEKVKQAEADFELGRTLFFQGDYAQAVKKLADAVKANPTKSSYKLLLAKAYRYARQPAQARGLLEAVLKENPDHVEAGVFLAEILLAEKKYDEVIRTLAPLLNFKHDYPLYHMLAVAYYQKDQMAKAREHFEEAVKLNPASGQDFYQLANIYLAQNRFANAAAAYEQAHALGAETSALHFKLASVYFNLRNYLGRVRTVEVVGGKVGQIKNEMYLIDPVPGRKDHFYAAPARSAIFQAAKAQLMGINVVQVRFLEGNIWLNARRFAKADAIYSDPKLLKELPKSDKGLFWFYWARTALGQDNFDAYLERLGQAIAAEPEVYKPTLADAYVTVATRYQQRGDNAKYIEYLAKAVNANPMSAGLHLLFGDALWQMGKQPEAAEQYKLTLELEPDHGQRVRLLNRIRTVAGQAKTPEPKADS